MKAFVVGYADLFDNDLKLEKVHADSLAEAVRISSFVDDCEFSEEIQPFMFECDVIISAIEI